MPLLARAQQTWEEVPVLDMHHETAKDVRGTAVCAKDLQVTRVALLRYRGAMAGVVRSVGINGAAVEDVVHDAFEMACRKAEAERPDPRDEARFGGWLCTLARYAALTSRNDTIRNREISSPSEELEGVPEINTAYISHFDDKVAVAVVLSNLSADDRTLLHQHYYEEKTVQELAVERGIPWTTMRSRLDGVIHRARTIMDDKSGRQRVHGASVLTCLVFFLSEVYARLYASWSRSKKIVSATVVGLVTGGVVAAALLGPLNQNANQNANPDKAWNYASYAGAIPVVDFAAIAVSATKRATLDHTAGVSSGFKSCFAVQSVLAPAVFAVVRASSETRSTSTSVSTINVKGRLRIMVPWGVSSSVRDDKPKEK